MWVKAKTTDSVKEEEEKTHHRVEISHERRQGRCLGGHSALRNIRSPEGARRRDLTSPVIQRRATAQGRAIIQAAENFLPFLSPAPSSSPILSPPLFPSSSSSGRGGMRPTSPVSVRRSAQGTQALSCAPLSPFGGRRQVADLSSSTIVLDIEQRTKEKTERLVQVQRIREKLEEEKKRKNVDLQKEEEERGMWNQFWDVLEDVEAEKRLAAEDEEEAGMLIQRLSSGFLDEVLKDKCGEGSARLADCPSGNIQLMQLQERFKRYREEAREEEQHQMEQLGCVSPVVGSGCFEDNEFFRHLLQVRHRSGSSPASTTPPLLFSL